MGMDSIMMISLHIINLNIIFRNIIVHGKKEKTDIKTFWTSIIVNHGGELEEEDYEICK